MHHHARNRRSGAKCFLFVSTLCFSLVSGLTGCENEHVRFCQQAAASLCTQCASCGADGFRHCGLLKAKTEADCVQVVVGVCSVYNDHFNRELGRTCLERIDQLTCPKIQKEGKPEMCNRLF
ncbi:MAG: hypothetical protein FWC40_09965 [Proteobacteria bacterium]|nr:hypothetical protein [Pseudomonadota bacterium]